LIWLVAVVWISMNTVGYAVNCNCCCKALNRYGYDPDGAGAMPTKCWGFDRFGVLEGLIVDAGVCIQESKPTGVTTTRWEFYGCNLLCLGRLPAGFADPNPLQEADGDIPDTAVNAGTWEEDNCGEPDASAPPPPNGCG
jgi:hypothetical protein